MANKQWLRSRPVFWAAMRKPNGARSSIIRNKGFPRWTCKHRPLSLFSGPKRLFIFSRVSLIILISVSKSGEFVILNIERVSSNSYFYNLYPKSTSLRTRKHTENCILNTIRHVSNVACRKYHTFFYNACGKYDFWLKSVRK